jgi:hypothetical protein
MPTNPTRDEVLLKYEPKEKVKRTDRTTKIIINRTLRSPRNDQMAEALPSAAKCPCYQILRTFPAVGRATANSLVAIENIGIRKLKPKK